MQEQNSEYSCGERIEYRQYTCAFRGYVFLSERLDGESDAAADYRERQYGSPLTAALRHAQILKYESSYKSESGAKYDAMEVAMKRAKAHGAVLVLGSATPSAQDFYRGEQGIFRRLDIQLKMRP